MATTPRAISVSTSIYRSGTSRGPYFLAKELPANVEERNDLLCSVMGSGHPLQIDGIGGGNSLTSKVAIVDKSDLKGVDVSYLFAQVSVLEHKVDTAPNCGNMLAAVAAFSIDRGLVRANPKAEHEVVTIRILNLNTMQKAKLQIACSYGEVIYNFPPAPAIAKPEAVVALTFEDTIGSKTGKLLPTGRPSEVIQGVPCSLIDMAVPVVFIPAAAVGLTGHEAPSEIDVRRGIMDRIESIRIEAASRMGLTLGVIPKVSLVSVPQPGSDATVTARYLTPHAVHKAYAVTGAICTAGAARLRGSVVYDMLSRRRQTVSIKRDPGTVAISHPSGILEIKLLDAGVSGDNLGRGTAAVLRTVSKVMEGKVYARSPTPSRSASVVGLDRLRGDASMVPGFGAASLTAASEATARYPQQLHRSKRQSRFEIPDPFTAISALPPSVAPVS